VLASDTYMWARDNIGCSWTGKLSGSRWCSTAV